MDNNKRTKSFINHQDLEYIKIDRKNKLVELNTEMHITEASSFLNILSIAEENLGGEMNNFFMSVLPENREGEKLKVITAVAAKTKIDKNILHEYLTNILNRPEEEKITLNRELVEEISTILREIFKKIKKKSKIKNYEDIIKNIARFNNDNLFKDDILKNFKTFTSSKNLGSINDSIKLINKDKMENDNSYKYKEIKLPKNIQLPLEMLILLRKFSMIKTLRLTINTDYYKTNENNSSFEMNKQSSITMKNELENNILILLNLEWLFPNLVNLELDLSNIDIMESQKNLYKYSLDGFSKLINKETKISNYQITKNDKRESQSLFKSIFPNLSFPDENDILNNKMSNLNTSYNATNIDQDINYEDIIFSEEKYNKVIKRFIKRYKDLLEIIIIYGYFIGLMNSVINTKFIMPMNIGDEICQFLKNRSLLIDDFHILSFITKKNIITLSIEFNSLDSKSFEKVLNFINQNSELCKCDISFFPKEEFFQTELLYKLLQSSDEIFKLKKTKDKNSNELSFNKNIKFSTKVNEDLDEYILRKLSEYFEINMQNFFYLLTMNTKIYDLSLVFDIPTIIIKNGYYNNILMKFFLDLFILLDSTLSRNIKVLSLISKNFILDSRKYPILNDFCEKLNLFSKKENQMQSLTFIVKMYRMPYIYRFIPYNLTYLSIGSFDYETFENLVNYLTSSDFGIRTKLKHLKISLNNSLIDINQGKLFDIITRLLNEYPKELKEISLYTFLIISDDKLLDLLMKTNYNTLPSIFLQFSVKSILGGNKLEEKFEYYLSKETKNICLKTERLVELYTVKRNENLTNKIINLMINLEKINKDILQYDIFCNIEKFLCENERKKLIIQYK